MQKNISLPFRIMGIPDEDTVTGSQEEILDHYGISGTGLYKTALNLLKR
jgi:transketolase